MDNEQDKSFIDYQKGVRKTYKDLFHGEYPFTQEWFKREYLCEPCDCTYADLPSEPLTLEKIKEAESLIIKTMEDLKKVSDQHWEAGEHLHPWLKWFERLMNKMGWHRRYEILVFDKSKLGFHHPYPFL